MSLFCADGGAGCKCTGLECTVKSVGGWVNLTDLALDAIGAGYQLRVEAVVGSEALGDLCSVCETTPQFDAFAPSAVRYLRATNASRAACRLRPSPLLQVLGYSADLVLRPVPVSGMAFVGLMPCQGAALSGCSAGSISGTTQISFAGGVADFSNIWIEGAGGFSARFVVRMAGSSRVLDSPFPDMQVAVSNSVTGLRVVQQPSTCNPGFLLNKPPQVMILSALNSPGGGWVCESNTCSNSEQRVNLTAAVIHKGSGRDISFPLRSLTFLDSTTAEFNFQVSMDALLLFVRFILYYPSCSEQIITKSIVDTAEFSVTAYGPADIRFTGPTLTAVHHVNIPLTVTVVVEGLNKLPVYCPVFLDFYLISTSVVESNLTSAPTLERIIGECKNSTRELTLRCIWLGSNSTFNSEAVFTTLVPITGYYRVLIHDAEFNLFCLSNISLFVPEITSTRISAAAQPGHEFYSNLQVTSADNISTQMSNTISNGTEARNISPVVFPDLSSSSHASVTEFVLDLGLKRSIQSFELNSSRVFLAGELVMPPPDLRFLDEAGNIFPKNSGPWFFSYKYEEVTVHSSSCTSFICMNDIVCVNSTSQTSWCGKDLKFTVNNSIPLNISAPLKAGTYHTLSVSLTNWDSSEICQIKGEFYTFNLTSAPFIVFPGKVANLQILGGLQIFVAGEKSELFVKAVDAYGNEIEQGTIVVSFFPWSLYLSAKVMNRLDELGPDSTAQIFSAEILKSAGSNSSQHAIHMAAITVNMTTASSFALRISFRSTDYEGLALAAPMIWSDELVVIASKINHLSLSGMTDTIRAGDAVKIGVKVEDVFGNVVSHFSQLARLDVYINETDGLYTSISIPILNGLVFIQFPAPSTAGRSIRFNITLSEAGISGITGCSKIVSSEKLILAISRQPDNSWVPGMISVQPEISVQDIYKNLPDYEIYIIPRIVSCSWIDFNTTTCSDECTTCMVHKNVSSGNQNCSGPCALLRDGKATFTDLYIMHLPQSSVKNIFFVLKLYAAKYDGPDSSELTVLTSRETSSFLLQEFSSLQLNIQPTSLTVEDVQMSAPSVLLICKNNLICNTAQYPEVNISVCLFGSSRFSQSSHTSVAVINGTARFTNLVPSISARGLHLRFFLPDPYLYVESNAFDVKPSDYVLLRVWASCFSSICDVAAGKAFAIQIDVLNLDLKLVSRNCEISVAFAYNCKACRDVSLQGASKSLSINGSVFFNDLQIFPETAGVFEFQAVALPTCISDDLTFSISVINSDLKALSYSQQPGNGINNFPLSIQPILHMFDGFGNTAIHLNQSLVTSYFANYVNGSSCENDTKVISKTAPNISMGFITYSDLAVARHQLTTGACSAGMILTISINNISIESNAFEIRDFISLEILTAVTNRTFPAGVAFAQSARMIDSDSTIAESNVHWARVEVQNCRAKIDDPPVLRADGGYFNFSLNMNSTECLEADTNIFVPEWCQSCNLILIVTPYIPLLNAFDSGELDQLEYVNSVRVMKTGKFSVIPGPVDEMAFQVQPRGSDCNSFFREDPVIRLRNKQGALSSEVEWLYMELIQGTYLGRKTNASFRTASGLVAGILKRSSPRFSVLNSLEINQPGDSFKICVTRCPISFKIFKNESETCCKVANSSNLVSGTVTNLCNPYGPVFGTVCSEPFSIYNVNSSVGSAVLVHRNEGPIIAGNSLNISIRLLDNVGFAQASLTYSVQVSLFNLFGANQSDQLLGQTRQNSIAIFESDGAGLVHFTDLSIRKEGIFKVDFEYQPIPSFLSQCQVWPNISRLSNRIIFSTVGSIKENFIFDIVHGSAHHLVVRNQPSPVIQARTRITGVGGDISVVIVDKFGNDFSCPTSVKYSLDSKLCDFQNNVNDNPIQWNVVLDQPCVPKVTNNPCSPCESKRMALIGTLSFRSAGSAVFNNLSIFTSEAVFGASFNFTASFQAPNQTGKISLSESAFDFFLSMKSSNFNVSVTAISSSRQKPVTLNVLQQPSLKNNHAGFPFTVQPIISLRDEFGEIVSSEWDFVVTASLCKICSCPCTTKTGSKAADAMSSCSLADKQMLINGPGSFGSMYLVHECSQNASILQGNVAGFQGGLFRFPGLTGFTAQANVVMMFNVSVISSSSDVTHLINFSHTLDILSCSPHFVSISDSTPFLSVADTGGHLCDGGTCAVRFDDAFRNPANTSLMVFASLNFASNFELAGFGVPAQCRCSGFRNMTVDGVVLAYGTRCFPWDKDERTCKSLWPKCDLGIECCKSWCFVEAASCTDSLEHPSFPGMYVSYSACSDDLSSLMRCNWQSKGSCNKYANRDQDTGYTRLYGTTIVLSESGTAFFTDLLITDPGVYVLTFMAKHSNKILKYSSPVFGVTPLAARRLLVMREPQGSTVTSNGKVTVNLLHQPIIKLVDRYENALEYDKMCLAVTASIRSKKGKIYGQSISNPKAYYLENSEEYIITANAVNGIAAFTAMTVEPLIGSLGAVVINFTTGCCSAQVDDCYCSNAIDPFVKDYAVVLEPCAWAAAELRILESVETLFIAHQVRTNLSADDKIQTSIHLLSNGTVLLDAVQEYHISVGTEASDGEGFVILQGSTTKLAKNGIVNFTDLQITDLNGLSHRALRLHFSVVEHPGIGVHSIFFSVVAGAPRSMHLKNTVKGLTVNDAIQAQVVFLDQFSNTLYLAGLSVRIELTASFLADGAANVLNPLVGDTVAVSNGTGVYFGFFSMAKARIIVAGIHTLRFISGATSADLNLTVIPGEPAINSADWIAGTDQLNEICAWEPVRASLMILDSEKNAIFPGSKWILTIEILSASLSSTLIGMLKCSAEARGVDFTFGSDSCAVFTLSSYSTGETATGTLKLFDVSWSMLVPRAQKSLRIFVQPPTLNLTLEICMSQSRLPVNFNLLCGSNLQLLPDCPGCEGRDASLCNCINQTLNEMFMFIPHIRLLHRDGSHAVGSTLTVSVHVVEPSCSRLVGSTTQLSVNGSAIFSNLGISRRDLDCHETRVALLFTASHLPSGSSEYVTINPSDYRWHIGLNPGVAYLELESLSELAIPDVVAGIPFDPLTTVALRCANCSEMRVTRSSRTIKTIIENAGGGLVDPEAFSGLTEVDALNGYAIFSDLIFKKSGSYNLRFISESSTFTAYSSRSNVFKVRPADTYILKIIEQPAVFAKSGEPLSAKVELLDIYNNTKSDDSNSIIISQIYSNEAERIDCTKFTALNCGCIGNSASSIFEFGTAEFRCLSVGQVGQNFTVSFQANGFQTFSRPFFVDPGGLFQIRILQQPIQFKAGNISTPIVIEFQDKCGNSISDSFHDTFVEVDVVPSSAGLAGTSMVRSSSGQAIFADLTFTRANSDDYGKGVGYTLHFYIQDISIVSKPFWVTNAEIFAFQIVDQPKDILQGKSMKPFPKLVLTDTYGNVAVSSSRGESSVVIVSLMQDNLQQKHSCSVACDGSIVNGRCYKYFSVKSSWADGKSLCETWGGEIARIWSQEEIQFGIDLTGGANAWIGLSYGQYGETYDWSWDENGERLDAQSQDWISRNLLVTPENTGSLNCMALGGQNDAWTFSATECSTLLPVICSKNSPVHFENSKTCYSCLPILGTNRISPENGTATFTDIQLFTSPGINYRLHFVLERFRSTIIGKYLSLDQMKLNTESREFSLLQGTEVSQAFEIFPRVSGMSIFSQPGICTNAQVFGTQPALLLLDFLGRKVQIDGVHASVKLSESPQLESATLGGNRTAVSTKGLILFTDLSVLYPSPLQESFTLEFNAFDSSDSFTIFSSPFIVSPAASQLLLLHEGTCVGFTEYPCVIGAGDLIEVKLQMLDQYNEIVENCSAVVVVTVVISGASENALVGGRQVQCNHGIVSFTDIQVVKASDSASLLFSIKSLGMSVHTTNFSVLQGNLANLVFTVQPSSAIAGDVLPVFLVSTTDLWGNVVRSDIQIDIFVRLGDVCLSDVISFKNTTTAGLAVFSTFSLHTAGRFYLNARFSEKCDPLQLLNPLQQYLYATAVSSVFEIFPSVAAGISVLQPVTEENVAGEVFRAQPSCIVRDQFGNNVSVQYKVKIRVIDRFGLGCLCNLSEPGQLCAASVHPSVLAFGDNAISQEEDPSVNTVGGVAQFEHLKCTRKSCANSESPSSNCNYYKFSCEVVDSQFPQCLDCKAVGNIFHVRANEVNGLVVSEIGFAVSGRSRIDDETAGFYEVLNDTNAWNHAKLDAIQRLLKPPSFFLVDRYGNVNESAHGLASVRISPTVKIAGYSFCNDRSSKEGTLCLGGQTIVTIQNGTAVFTDLTILHSGPSFQLKFRFQNVEKDSALFNVLPTPPKASGVTIGADYSSLMIHFDRAVFTLPQGLFCNAFSVYLVMNFLSQ